MGGVVDSVGLFVFINMIGFWGFWLLVIICVLIWVCWFSVSRVVVVVRILLVEVGIKGMLFSCC